MQIKNVRVWSEDLKLTLPYSISYETIDSVENVFVLIELENGTVITGPGFTILFKDLPVEYYRIEKCDINTVKCLVKKLDSCQP